MLATHANDYNTSCGTTPLYHYVQHMYHAHAKHIDRGGFRKPTSKLNLMIDSPYIDPLRDVLKHGLIRKILVKDRFQLTMEIDMEDQPCLSYPIAADCIQTSGTFLLTGFKSMGGHCNVHSTTSQLQ